MLSVGFLTDNEGINPRPTQRAHREEVLLFPGETSKFVEENPSQRGT